MTTFDFFGDEDSGYDPFPGEIDPSYPCKNCGGQGFIPVVDWVMAVDPEHPTEMLCSYCGGDGRVSYPPEPTLEEDRCCNESFGDRCRVDWICPSAPYARRRVIVDLPLIASSNTAVFKQYELDALKFLQYRINTEGIES